MRLVSKALPFALSLVAFAIPSVVQAAQTIVQSGQWRAASGERVLRRPLGAHSIVTAARRATPVALCSRPRDVRTAGCFAAAILRSGPMAAFPDSVNGLTPNDLSSLYSYPGPQAQGVLGAGATIAVVVAGDYANAEADLAIYRQYYGLPTCSSASGCLTKVGAAAPGQAGASGSPTSVSANPTTPNAIGWAAETDVDTQMVSAVCPNCRIVIAEAASASLGDLTTAVSAAIAAGATIVNTSFGAPESVADVSLAPTYESPKVKVVAAAGDWGYGVYFPAADPKVVAVGGTSIQTAGSAVSETVWAGTGSGCSRYFSKPAWQNPIVLSLQVCPNRTVADTAAVADPKTGVAFYDSTLYGAAGGGWAIVGGTSVSAPIVAGMFALSGQAGQGLGAQVFYNLHYLAFLTIATGSNGSCSPAYLCNGGLGYNGPTGLGVPQGLTGF